jgi:DNA-binding response OmpR family regulator
VLARLRERGDESPVLLVSGYTGEELSAGECAERVGFLHKPFRAAELAKALRVLVLRSSKRSEST